MGPAHCWLPVWRRKKPMVVVVAMGSHRWRKRNIRVRGASPSSVLKERVGFVQPAAVPGRRKNPTVGKSSLSEQDR